MGGRAPLNALLVLLAVSPVALTVVDFVMARNNQALRVEIDKRQHLINQGAQLAHANQALIRQIALAAVKDRDGRLRELLSRNGITVNIAPVPPADSGKGG